MRQGVLDPSSALLRRWHRARRVKSRWHHARSQPNLPAVWAAARQTRRTLRHCSGAIAKRLDETKPSRRYQMRHHQCIGAASRACDHFRRIHDTVRSPGCPPLFPMRQGDPSRAQPRANRADLPRSQLRRASPQFQDRHSTKPAEATLGAVHLRQYRS